MNETKVEQTRVRGFAGLVKKILEPLNDHPKFQEEFGDMERKFLINPSNLDFAALITIENARLTVESVKNKPKENLNKDNVGWDGFVSMDTETFMALALDRISLLSLGWKWLTGKFKMKGIFKLLKLMKLMKLLEE